MQEQRISGVLGPFSSFESLTLAFVLFLRDVLQAAAMLPERGGKQQQHQQHQLSQKGSVDKEQASSVHESETAKVAPKGTKHQPSSAPPPITRNTRRTPGQRTASAKRDALTRRLARARLVRPPLPSYERLDG